MVHEILKAVAVIGFLLSLYALHVENKARKTKGKYKALCDINDIVSCSSTLTSKYSTIFGISNSYLGILFYTLIFILTFFDVKYIFYLAILSGMVTVYLAYLLYFKLRKICLVCNSLYVVNIFLLIISALEYF